MAGTSAPPSRAEHSALLPSPPAAGRLSSLLRKRDRSLPGRCERHDVMDLRCCGRAHLHSECCGRYTRSSPLSLRSWQSTTVCQRCCVFSHLIQLSGKSSITITTPSPPPSPSPFPTIGAAMPPHPFACKHDSGRQFTQSIAHSLWICNRNHTCNFGAHISWHTTKIFLGPPKYC